MQVSLAVALESPEPEEFQAFSEKMTAAAGHGDRASATSFQRARIAVTCPPLTARSDERSCELGCSSAPSVASSRHHLAPKIPRGLVLWIIYVFSDSDALGWIAFAILVLVAILGWTMFAIWWQRRQARAAAAPASTPGLPAEQRFPVAIVTLHRCSPSRPSCSSSWPRSASSAMRGASVALSIS
jgi:hypothetical protein